MIKKYEDEAEVIQKEEADYQKKTIEDFKFELDETVAAAKAKYLEAKENNFEAQALSDIKTSGMERYKNLQDEKKAKIQEHKDKLAKRMEENKAAQKKAYAEARAELTAAEDKL